MAWINTGIKIYLFCRSLVPKCDIQVLSGYPPKPNTKTKHWNMAMLELKKYGENIDAMREKLVVKDKSLSIIMPKGRAGAFSGGSSEESPTKQAKQQIQLASEHVSFTPPMVEVTPSSSGQEGRMEEGIGSISDAEVSSPGTPPRLQIDLEGSGHRSSSVGGNANQTTHDKSPSRGRAMPSGGGSLIRAMRRNSQVPGSLDFNNESPLQAVVMGTPSVGQTGGLKCKRKGMKAGDALSALISSITQRKMGGHGGGGVVCPQVPPGATASVDGGAVGLGPGGHDDTDPHIGKQKVVSADDSQERTSSPFSAIYVDRHKTAIALVDPNQKRPKRKTAKVIGNEPHSKKARLLNTVSGVQGSTVAKTSVGSKADSPGTVVMGKAKEIVNDPAAYVAKIQEYGSVAIGAFSKSTSTSSSTSVPSSTTISSHLLPNQRMEVSCVNTSLSSSPMETAATAVTIPSDKIVSSSTFIPPSISVSTVAAKPRSSSGGKRKKKGSEKNRGKSPHKNVVGAPKGTPGLITPKISIPAAVINNLAATIAAPTTQLHPSGSSSTSLTSTSSLSSSQPTGQGGNLAYPVSLGASTRHDSPSSRAAEVVRGEEAAQGIGEVGTSNLPEGIGLMEGTMVKVSNSFLARVNNLGGSSEDMGYNYFMEKVGLLV